MKRFVMIGLVAICGSSGAQNADLSGLPATVVNTLAPAATAQSGFTRLRVNLTSDSASGHVVRLAGLAVCSRSACYESAAPSTVAISSTSKGASSVVAELEVPFSEIVGLRFRSVGGQGVLQGSVLLPEALRLEREHHGGDVLVLVRQRGSQFVPVSAASNYLQPEGTAVYYNPVFETTVQLPHGVVLSIPAGALTVPKVFVVGVHDTGDQYPLVDIYPGVKLAKQAKVLLPTIARAAQARQSGQSPPTPRPAQRGPAGSPSSVASAATGAGGLRILEIGETGVVRPTPVAPAASKPVSSSTIADPSTEALAVTATSGCNAFGWCNCATQMAYAPNQQIISNDLPVTGTVYLDWCTTIAPYVHMTVSNLADPSERFTVKHENKVNVFGVNRVPLRRLTSWSQYTQAMINGFHWEGDVGNLANQHGLPNGYVGSYGYASGSNVLGANRVGGGVCEDFINDPSCVSTSQSAGLKRVMLAPDSGPGVSWFDYSQQGVIFGGVNSYVSSGTSIVKNGACFVDSELKRWSAVGTTTAGRVIFMSSTSDSTTTAAQLCPVFLAMGAVNAVLLDGGSSTALAVDGFLKNPITGMPFLVFGSSRYIPYSLKVSYPGW